MNNLTKLAKEVTETSRKLFSVDQVKTFSAVEKEAKKEMGSQYDKAINAGLKLTSAGTFTPHYSFSGGYLWNKQSKKWGHQEKGVPYKDVKFTESDIEKLFSVDQVKTFSMETVNLITRSKIPSIQALLNNCDSGTRVLGYGYTESLCTLEEVPTDLEFLIPFLKDGMSGKHRYLYIINKDNIFKRVKRSLLNDIKSELGEEAYYIFEGSDYDSKYNVVKNSPKVIGAPKTGSTGLVELDESKTSVGPTLFSRSNNQLK